MLLEKEAWQILRPYPFFNETSDLFENDLTLIEANLKRHI